MSIDVNGRASFKIANDGPSRSCRNIGRADWAARSDAGVTDPVLESSLHKPLPEEYIGTADAAPSRHDRHGRHGRHEKEDETPLPASFREPLVQNPKRSILT